MKKQLSKRSIWQSILSVVALGIFVLLAAGSLGSFGGPIVTLEKLDDGNFREITHYESESYSYITVYHGKRDEYGRWHGPVLITKSCETEAGSEYFREEVNMVNGKRHGKSITTTYDAGGIKTCWYVMGKQTHCEKKAALVNTEASSAFQVLSNKYSWFLLTLNAFGYEDEYVAAFTDSLETVLDTYEFEYFDFDDYYANAIYDLEWTVYDSIVKINSMLSYYQGVVLLRNSEFRMAVIDRYRSDRNSTFNIVNTTYPGYLLSVNDVGVNDQDFERFCQDMDSCMTSYGNLDLEDSFFVDSVDARMYRAISYIFSAKKSSFYSTPADVANVVLTIMFQQFDQGDIIKRAVKEAYFINTGVVSIPTVTTEFSGNNSATSVTLNGYVIEDGGAEVTSRGIAWATYYNPTTDDHAEASGTGTGTFTITLDNLTEGATYYARSYATNSTGTAYGNCIEFTATSTIGIDHHEMIMQELNIYPNPASAFTTFSFHVEYSESMVLTITNMKGQVTMHHDLGSLPAGENQVVLDLSLLQNGIYNCQLKSNGTIKYSRKVIIVD